jgi:hypothetical protein
MRTNLAEHYDTGGPVEGGREFMLIIRPRGARGVEIVTPTRRFCVPDWALTEYVDPFTPGG